MGAPPRQLARTAPLESARWALRSRGRARGEDRVTSVLEGVSSLLDEAHRELAAADLAAVLLSVRPHAEALLRGEVTERPGNSLTRAGALAPAGRVYTRLLHVHLHRHGALLAPVRRGQLGAELERLLEEAAARPRGSAAPAP